MQRIETSDGDAGPRPGACRHSLGAEHLSIQADPRHRALCRGRCGGRTNPGADHQHGQRTGAIHRGGSQAGRQRQHRRRVCGPLACRWLHGFDFIAIRH